MTQLLPFLKQLISAPGLSGFESPVRDLIEEAWRPLVDQFSISRLGSLHALKKGDGPLPRPALLVTAHMDAIGLMVAGIVEEFLQVSAIGGLDVSVLPGQPVVVHGKEELPGVIVLPPTYLLPSDKGGESGVKLEYLLIDLGLPKEALETLIRVGDLVSFSQPPLELSDDYLTGHSLDNRASIAALTVCLQALKGKPLYWDIWAAATTLEEENLGGARTSAFQLRPNAAVAVDVTFGQGPGSPDYLTFPLGKGPTLAWGPNIHPGLHKGFRLLADQLEIPYHLEPIASDFGTEAARLQSSAEGIPTMLLEIPIRYMHTPIEMVAIKDIQRTGQLIAEFIGRLDGTFLDRLSLDV